MLNPQTDAIAAWLDAPFDEPTRVPEPLVRLVDALRAVDPQQLTRNDPAVQAAAARQAAVLILIATDRSDGPDVLLQQRSSALRDHPGQVSFPGGSRDGDDLGPTDTAVREAVEETGIDPTGVDPLALLPRVHIPPSRFDVTGVVAHWRAPSPVRAVDVNETSRVMRVPLGVLADPANRVTLRTSSGWQGPAFELESTLVWGYTGEILAALLRMGGWERPWDTSRIIGSDRLY